MYQKPNDFNQKNPHRFGTKDFDRFELEKTVSFINTFRKDKEPVKAVLLTSNDKQTNYNQKKNTIYVKPADTNRFVLLKDLIFGSSKSKINSKSR